MNLDELIDYVERKSDNLTAFSGDTIIRHLKSIKATHNIQLEQAFNAAREISPDPRTDLDKYYDDGIGLGKWETPMYKDYEAYKSKK